MSRIFESSHEIGFEDGDVEGVAGERDPVRSVDCVVYHMRCKHCFIKSVGGASKTRCPNTPTGNHCFVWGYGV